MGMHAWVWARNGRRRRAAAAGLLLAAAWAGAAPSDVRAQDVFFEDLPTGDLVEMHGAIGRELSRRGVYGQQFDPTSAYARWLFRSALTLKIDTTGQADAVDATGERYTVVGLRLGEATRLPALDASSFDFLGVVLFTPDHRVQRAGLIPVGGVIDLLEEGAAIEAGAESAFWRLPSMVDVTPDIYLQATSFDISTPG